jgi:hypothetical protein
MEKTTLEWSRLISLRKEEIEKLTILEGVYRLSEKRNDGKFYVVYIGSTMDIKQELLDLLLKKDGNFLKQGEFSFRYAPVKGESMRKAIEKQMYRQYAPQFNETEPQSVLDIKVNLN